MNDEKLKHQESIRRDIQQGRHRQVSDADLADALDFYLQSLDNLFHAKKAEFIRGIQADRAKVAERLMATKALRTMRQRFWITVAISLIALVKSFWKK